MPGGARRAAARPLWEVLEFAARVATHRAGMEAVLVQYGPEDTLADLVFDTAGPSSPPCSTPTCSRR